MFNVIPSVSRHRHWPHATRAEVPTQATRYRHIRALVLFGRECLEEFLDIARVFFGLLLVMLLVMFSVKILSNTGQAFASPRLFSIRPCENVQILLGEKAKN